MKKKAATKAARNPAAKTKSSPKRTRRDPRALTEQQLRRELGIDDAKWAWCLENGLPFTGDGTFDLVAVVAWILKGSAKRHGGR